jgi:hypothetical protein
MNNKDNPEQEALRGENELMAFLVKELQSEKFQALRQKAAKGPHPTSEMLYRYVLDESDAPEARTIREHIAFCKMCADELLQIRQIEENMKERLSEWVHSPPQEVGPATAEDIPPPKVKGELLEGVATEFRGPPSTLEAIPSHDLLEGVATELWKPPYVGKIATAGDIPEQKHVFKQEEGDIEIACYWRGAYRKQPAYIRIRWKAGISVRKEIRARFINPETHETRAEVSLGTEPDGKKVFSSRELHFDPSREQWAIMLVLAEVKK